MGGLPDPDWYLDNVLVFAEPGVGATPDLGPAAGWQEWWRQRAAEFVGDVAGELAARQGFVVTTGQLATLGWQPHDVRREVRRSRWSRPARGVLSPVVMRGNDHVEMRRAHCVESCASVLVRPEHVISGRSAAILHGLPTMAIPSRPVSTTRSTNASGRRQRVHVHSASLDATAITSWFGAPVGTIARTLIDLGRLDRRDAIMAADAALRESLVTSPELALEFAGATGWPRIKQARAVLSLADPRAESPLESIVRLALHDDGFPPPEPQFEIGGDRVDFCWPKQRLILEADGRAKYTDDELWDEKKRETRLRGHGFRVERVLWGDVMATWPATRRRLWAVLVG